MTKLEEVKAAMKRIDDLRQPLYPSDKPNPTTEDFGKILFMEEHIIKQALAIYKAILEKRVLLVPICPTVEMLLEGSEYDCNSKHEAIKVYKAMTQAVDVEKLIEEITG